MSRIRILVVMAVVVAAAAIGPARSSAGSPPDRPPPPKERIVIHGVGDILLCHCFHRAFVTAGYELAFSGMNGLFTRDALTVGNLECAPGNGGRMLEDKPFVMRCDTTAYPVMASAGVDVVSLANNHAGDAGMQALLRGMGDLRNAGITPVGAGSHRAQAIQPAIFVRGGWSIAVVGFTAVGGGPGWAAGLPRDPGTAWADPVVMERVVRSLDEVFDVAIVTIHQGAGNYGPNPTAAEVATGHALIDAGADVVMAHHHHRVLSTEVYRDRPIFWGLGDFVWSRYGDHRDESGVAEIVVEADGSITGRLIPAFIVSHGHPVLRGQADPDMQWQPPPYH